MAKILVADDNSNVQKTVTLALAELGIEVLAVNNGDAAVRKLADFSPDLVLADIFMPVRNGYEVCEYVKKDSRFAHVPVVLLVGAFDPLDEKEAQRVGADGILKKPFVPPEPLITMVKMLLDRTLGERLVEVSASKPAAVSAATARARTGGSGGGSAIAEERPPVGVASEEPPAPDFHPPAGRVAFAEGEHPIAFSQLLETPAQDAAAPSTGLIEPVDDEQILTSSRDATLGDPIFWRNDEPASEPEPEIEQLDDVSSPLAIRTWKQGDDSLPRREDAALLQPIEPIESIGRLESIGSTARIEPDEPLEFIREGQDETSRTIVESGSILLDPAGQAPLTVESDKAKELADNPIEWMASAPSEHILEISPENVDEQAEEHSAELIPELSPEHSEVATEATPGWEESILDATSTIDLTDDDSHTAVESEHPQVVTPASISLSESVPASIPVRPPDPVKVLAPVASNVTPPTTSSPTFAIAFPVAPSVTPPVSAQLETKLTDKTPEPIEIQPPIPVRPLTQSAEDTVRSVPKQDWADLTASLQSRTSEVIPQKVSPDPVPAAPIPAAAIENPQAAAGTPGIVSSPDPALVEAVVQRVLDKMRPQVVDIITKEFLRPIVQALVTREIEKH